MSEIYKISKHSMLMIYCNNITMSVSLITRRYINSINQSRFCLSDKSHWWTLRVQFIVTTRFFLGSFSWRIRRATSWREFLQKSYISHRSLGHFEPRLLNIRLTSNILSNIIYRRAYRSESWGSLIRRCYSVGSAPCGTGRGNGAPGRRI